MTLPESTTPTTRLCDTPNQHSRPPKLQILDHVALFHGYQEYALTRETVWPLLSDWPLGRKYQLLKDHVTPRQFAGRTVLDLGSNAGFFVFWALQQGAVRGTSVDMDPAYIQMLQEARNQFGFALDIHQANAGDWTQGADCVFALALIHWLYSCTATAGSLEAVIGALAALTGYLLVVEYVDPEDSAIRDFQHLDWNPHLAREPYSRAAFEAALSSHFARWTRVGDVIPTRSLYLAYKTRHDLDLRCPLPRLHPDAHVLTSRLLTSHGARDYWSVVYDIEDAGRRIIRKQTTGNLAAREAALLSRLSSPYFPRVLATHDDGASSVADIEWIDGELLSDAAPALRRDDAALAWFVSHLPHVLHAMHQAEIVHRDIHPDNLLVRDGKPVLIDFGWAVTPDLPQFLPDGLQATREAGTDDLTMEPTHCDVRAMARLVSWLAPERYPALEGALDLFEHPDASCRLAGRALRQQILEAVLEVDATGPASPLDPQPDGRAAALISALVEHVGRRGGVLHACTERLAAVQNELETTRQALVESQHALGVSHAACEALTRERRTEPPAVLAWVHTPCGAGAASPERQLRPQDATLLFRHAQELRAAGATALAHDVAVRVLDVLSDWMDPEERLALMYFVGSIGRELGRFDEALAMFDALLASCGPAIPDVMPIRYPAGAHFHSALMYEALGDVVRARERLSACVALVPDHRGALDAIRRLSDPTLAPGGSSSSR